jgi:trimeric autotransporter adhesin
MNSLNSTSAANVIPIFAMRQRAQPTAQAKRTLAAFGAMLMLLIAMMVGGSMQSAYAQAAPANSTIGNQASATYVDTAAPLVTLSSTSNLVETTVSQVYSFTLTAPGAQTKPLNQQVCYPHTITNTGNGNDTFALTAPVMGGTIIHVAPIAYYVDAAPTDGVPDNMTPITSTGALSATGPSSIFNFVVCAQTPAVGMVGQTGTISVTATSSAPMMPPTNTVVDTTTIGNCSITLTKSLQSVAPPGVGPVSGGASPNAGPLFVVLNYTNSGTIGCTNVIINDPLPSGFLYVLASGRWSGSGMTALGDGAAADPAGITYTSPTTPVTGTISATLPTVAGSTSGQLYFQVTVAGSLPVGNNPATQNTANVTFTDPVAMTTTGPNPSNTTTYTVAQVAAVAFNGSATLSGIADADPVTVASASPGQTITWTDYVWNNGNAPDTFDIQFIDGTGTAVGTSATFAGANCAPGNMAANACTFPVGTTFTMYQPNGMTTLLNSTGTAAPDTGSIPLPVAMACPSPYIVNAAGTRCGYPIVITATIPMGAVPPTGPHRIALLATSVANNAITDVVTNVLTALVANTVDLTNNLSVAGGAMAAQGLGSTGMTVITTNTVTPSTTIQTVSRFRLHVNNTSATPAIYDLTATYISVPAGVGLAVPPVAPVNWSTTFKLDGGVGDCSTVTGGNITTTGAMPIAANAQILICAEVTIPPTNQGGMSRPTDSPPGNYVIEYRVQQQGNAAVFDTKRDQVTLNQAHSVSITPNGMQQTSPGGAVTYQHSITNTGNIAENVTFPGAFLANSQNPPHNWTSTAYIDTNMNNMLDIGTDVQITNATMLNLAPNAAQVIFVRVSAPPAAGSPPNVTTITATYNTGMSTTSATDTTTLTSGLRLNKYQRTFACAGPAPTFTLTLGVPNAPWTSASLAASAATAPGQCIAYLIVGENTTANIINSISLTDVTPSNTKLETSCTPVAPNITTGPLFANSVPANATTGTISGVSAASNAGPANAMSGLNSGAFVTLQFCVRINAM